MNKKTLFIILAIVLFIILLSVLAAVFLTAPKEPNKDQNIATGNSAGAGVDILEKAVALAATPEGITVPYGTSAQAIGLPDTVVVIYADNTAGNLSVSWDTANYNGNAAGTYILEGTLQMSGAAANPDNVRVNITVEVQDNSVISATGAIDAPAEDNTESTLAPEEDEVYNFRVYMETTQDSYKAGNTFSVGVMLTGDVNYTQVMAAITYDAGLLEYTGHGDLTALVAEVKKSGADKISLRNVPSMNMVAGEPCETPVKLVTLKFKVKGGFAASSVDTDISFDSLIVTPAASAKNATTAPGEALSITLSK